MGRSTRLLPLVALAVVAGCTAPDAGVTEGRPGEVAATATASPFSAGGESGALATAADGADGQAGQPGTGTRGQGGDGSGGSGGGTPPTSSTGPGHGSFSVTNNDVMIGAQFADRNQVSFGSTSPGSTQTRTIGIGSLSPATVSSRDMIDGSTVFRVVADGCTGASVAGEPCRVTVAATPPDEGEYEGVLLITHSLGTTTVDLAVTAEGADPALRGTAEETAEETAQPEDPPTTSG